MNFDPIQVLLFCFLILSFSLSSNLKLAFDLTFCTQALIFSFLMSFLCFVSNEVAQKTHFVALFDEEEFVDFEKQSSCS